MFLHLRARHRDPRIVVALASGAALGEEFEQAAGVAAVALEDGIDRGGVVTPRGLGEEVVEGAPIAVELRAFAGQGLAALRVKEPAQMQGFFVDLVA